MSMAKPFTNGFALKLPPKMAVATVNIINSLYSNKGITE